MLAGCAALGTCQFQHNLDISPWSQSFSMVVIFKIKSHLLRILILILDDLASSLRTQVKVLSYHSPGVIGMCGA